MRRRIWRKCPKCGSRNYDSTKTVDIRIIHHRGSRVVERRIEYNTGGHPWFIECRDCGFVGEDGEDG